jgi:SAM-dependent methyltransferase
LDYSDIGIRRLQNQLDARGLTAELVVGDLFEPTSLGRGRFDVVFSLGLVEHFRDGVAAVTALNQLLKPSGTLLTAIPNMVGLWGRIQKQLDRAVYDLHMLYAPKQLDELHRRADLEVVSSARFFGGFGPLVMNAPTLSKRHPRFHRSVLGGLWIVQQGIAWPSGLLLGKWSESEMLSSHVLGVYRRSH